MDNEIEDLLKQNSKSNMPDLWDKIDRKIEKKTRKKRKLMNIAASIAIVLITGCIAIEFTKNNNRLNSEITSDNKVENNGGKINNEVAVLGDLDLNKILEGKVVINGSMENCYVDYSTEENYKHKSDVIVYGKVVNVKTYVKFDVMIYSDITIEVIKDYRNKIKQSDTITICMRGGELTVEDIISQLPQEYSMKHGYDKVEDKSEKVIQLKDGLPIYRIGEYVLIYANSVESNDYYNENLEYANSLTYDFDILKGFYVNPNSGEVFDYSVDSEGKVSKQYIGKLDELKNQQE